jgi:hypothetical protein
LSAIGTSFGKFLPVISKTRQVIAIEQQLMAYSQRQLPIDNKSDGGRYDFYSPGLLSDEVGIVRSSSVYSVVKECRKGLRATICLIVTKKLASATKNVKRVNFQTFRP